MNRTKKCSRCQLLKSIKDFWKDNLQKSKLRPECKDCSRKYNRTERAIKVRKIFNEKYNKTPDRKACRKKLKIIYNSRHKDKVSVWNKTSRAKKLGIIKRKDNCEICKSKNLVQAHHPDYKKPLYVRWLCVICHNKVHYGTINL